MSLIARAVSNSNTNQNRQELAVNISTQLNLSHGYSLYLTERTMIVSLSLFVMSNTFNSKVFHFEPGVLIVRITYQTQS